MLAQAELSPTTSAKRQLLQSLKDREYRAAFVEERVKTSVALQIRALREQRNKMTQKQLGDAIGMAQTWVSKLENPDYGKMTVATLLRLATDAFDTDLEIKFRTFSETLSSLPTQGPEYFSVPSFDEELPDLEKESTTGSSGVLRIVTKIDAGSVQSGNSILTGKIAGGSISHQVLPRGTKTTRPVRPKKFSRAVNPDDEAQLSLLRVA